MQKLKLGILIDSFDLPAWVYFVLERIAREDSAEFALVILNNDGRKQQGSNWNVGLYSIFNWLDEKLFAKEPNPFLPKNAAGLLSNAPIIKVHPTRKESDCFFEETDLNKIREHHLDVLIKFGFDGLRCESLNASKYGTWFYYHGDDRVMRSGPPGFWEVAENQSETVSALLASGGIFSSTQVLYRSHFFTYPLSPARHRSYFFWASAAFLPRQIKVLQREGEEKFLREIKKFNAAPHPEVKGYETPSSWATIQVVVKLIGRLVKEFLQRILFLGQWFLLFSLRKEKSNNFKTFEKLIPPKNKFWADPHIVKRNGSYYIFIEEFLASKGRGHISYIELDEDGNWKEPVKILEKDYHLSYPFLFEWDGRLYMVPESRANRTIDLYECVQFPHEWKFKQHLMENISAVDSTLVHLDGKWWMFTGIAEHEAAAPNVELFLFYTDDLFGGKWISHPQNPVVSDVKRARPAGSIFLKDGKLFRPSQDCTKMYGYGFDLNEIEVISETDYRERRIVLVRPNWDKDILATHTFASCGNLTVIDAFMYARKIG